MAVDSHPDRDCSDSGPSTQSSSVPNRLECSTPKAVVSTKKGAVECSARGSDSSTGPGSSVTWVGLAFRGRANEMWRKSMLYHSTGQRELGSIGRGGWRSDGKVTSIPAAGAGVKSLGRGVGTCG